VNFNTKLIKLCVRVLRYMVIVKYQAIRIVCIRHWEQLDQLCGFLYCYNLPEC